MKITKVGHCCLVIQIGAVTILTDPGGWTTAQNDITGIDAILITHEHGDHLHIESLKTILKNNPKARVITNKAVSAILEKENLQSEIVGDKQTTEVNGILVEGFGADHGKVYENLPDVENTGYFLGNTFFYPGDSFYNPGKHVDILALPVGGPWMKLQEALIYARKLKPRIAFPVHDGLFNVHGIALTHDWPTSILKPFGITYVSMVEGSAEEF